MGLVNPSWIVVEDIAFKFDRELKLSRATESSEVVKVSHED